jgi:hypothetical protein
MRKSLLIAALLGGCLVAAPAAATVSINFENIATYNANTGTAVQNFYNGGTASNGASGPNLGVSFASNALTLCLTTASNFCTPASRGGLGDPASAFTAMYFAEGTSTSLSDAAGFTNGISFFYVTRNDPGTVQIFDGVNGTGNLLASLDLAINATTCGAPFDAEFCPFTIINLGFTGTGRSVVFGGTANQIAFDDIALGVAVPEPATWAMMLVGFGVLGFALRRRRRAVAIA